MRNHHAPNPRLRRTLFPEPKEIPMSNVVSLGVPRRPDLSQRQALLLESFACSRRPQEDVFWLKENAEILNILATGGAILPPDALAVYAQVYEGLEERLRFFPQYYRFLLSICLDLEDLGMPGGKGEDLCAWVARHQLAEAELSDLQRAEAQQLLARRGLGRPSAELTGRLQRFAARPATFGLPNKKAAYELTHIVFYLSGYGRHVPSLPGAVATSLEYAGLLAYLDQDVDLLAEVCVALRFMGVTPSPIWEDWLGGALDGFSLHPCTQSAPRDAYHEYLVTSWWAGLTGRTGFAGTPPKGGVEIRRYDVRRGPLRAMSEYLFHLGPARSGDWAAMRHALSGVLDVEADHILQDAELSTQHFNAFFENFARAGA